MLTCIPQSLCTQNFRVLGASTGSAALTFNFFTEQGSISLGQTEFTVGKHGHWTFERDGQTAADVHLTVKAHSALTRGAFIECASEIPKIAQLFCFWPPSLSLGRYASHFNTLHLFQHT